MREKPSPWLERWRIRHGRFSSETSYGNNGMFIIPNGTGGHLRIIVSDGAGWEHVSVCPHEQDRIPTWEEMQYIKSLFWGPEETVVQYHPAKSAYVNCHPDVLHLWKPIGVVLPTPPTNLIGPV